MTQSTTIIPDKIFFKIGEVCSLLDVQAHVLRYWETEFPMLSPKKNRSGQRTYRRKDVEIAFRIRELLYEEMFTIAGAKKRLQGELKGEIEVEDRKDDVAKAEATEDTTSKPERVPVVAVSNELSEEKQEALKKLVTQLLEVREILNSPKNGGSDNQILHSGHI
ncbi:MAG: MerR family transcriptional regulator [Pyrinomonadaceae bacterium]